MQDTQRMEQYLASIDRLTQRLVVLQEESRKTGKTATAKTITPASSLTDKTTNQQSRETSKAETEVDKANETLKTVYERANAAQYKLIGSNRVLVTWYEDLVESNDANAQLIKEQHAKTQLLNAQYKITYKVLNDWIDGSRQFNADTRQFFSSFSSIAASIGHDLTSFESAGKRALASSKGLLSKGQIQKEAITQAVGLSRNIQQFGIVAGVAMSSVTFATSILKREQEKLEFRAKLALFEEQNNRDIELIYKQQLTKDKTPKELELESLNSSVERNERDHSKLSDLIIAGKADSAEAKYLAEKTAIFDGEEKERNKKIEQLKAQVDSEKLRQKQIAELIDAEIALKDSLHNVHVQSYETNYKALENAYAEAKKALYDKLDGDTPTVDVLNSIIDIEAKNVSTIINGLKQKYQAKSAKLQANPPTKDGNVLQVALQEAETKLLEDFQDAVRSKVSKMSNLRKNGSTWTFGSKTVKLKDDDANSLRQRQSEVQALITKELADAQVKIDEQVAKTDANKLKDEVDRLNLSFTELAIKISNKAALAVKNVKDGVIDPLSAIDAKEQELLDLQHEYEKAKASASEGAIAFIDAKIIDVKNQLEKLKADRALAARQAGDSASTLRMEKLDHDLSVAQSNDAIQSATNTGINANRRKQMQSSYGKIGDAYATYIDQAEQRRQFAQAKRIRDKRISDAEKELKLLGESASTESRRAELQKQITALKRQSELAELEQKKAITEQLYNLQYRLSDDKPTLRRTRSVTKLGDREPIEENSGYGHSTRLGSRRNYLYGRTARREVDFGLGLGSASARLTSDFNETWRRKHGKLTPEEKAAAKEERSLNNQLERAKRAVAKGGGTTKQKDLVAHYDKAKEAEKPVLEKILESADKALTHLSIMSGKKN